MSEQTFVCDECQRTLPRWMKHEDHTCAQCADNADANWDDPATSGDANDADNLEGEDTVGPLLDTPPEKEANDTPSKSETATGSHIIAPMWDTTLDTDAIESATDQNVTTTDEIGAASNPLDKKINSWKEQLLDLTRRSNLVNFSATKTKSLPFHRADPLTVASTIFDREPLYIRRSAQDE
ncbi:hypothetical protein DJ71_02440, partial [Halorubrum sp. E3]